ncbi:MAG: hypothetical protein ABSA42_16155 [Terracidiphilus sp.]|jgi:hypothetical protein
MDWENHPTLYQLTHWWHWLTYGQNAVALEASATVIAALVATAAGIFAACAYKATVAQLRIARNQLQLAHTQFDTERARFEEERRRTLKAARALFERTSAEEESTRPRFRVVSGYQSSLAMQNWEFRNLGSSAATDVSVSKSDESEMLAQANIIRPGESIKIQATYQTVVKEGVIFRFRTEFGSRWQLIPRLDGTEEIRNVTRNYEPEIETK